MTATRYTIAPVARPENAIHGYTLAQVEEITQLEPMDVEWAIEQHGECTTDEYRVTISPDADDLPNQHDVMQDPSEYAQTMLAFSGSKERAHREFSEAVDTDPSFRFAPRSWVNAVLAALS
jgi:hypothetical protein